MVRKTRIFDPNVYIVAQIVSDQPYRLSLCCTIVQTHQKRQREICIPGYELCSEWDFYHFRPAIIPCLLLDSIQKSYWISYRGSMFAPETCLGKRQLVYHRIWLPVFGLQVARWVCLPHCLKILPTQSRPSSTPRAASRKMLTVNQLFVRSVMMDAGVWGRLWGIEP